MLSSPIILNFLIPFEEVSFATRMVYPGPNMRRRFLFLCPCVPEEAGQDSEGFMEIAETTLPHARLTAIFNAVRKGTFDDEEGIIQFILEEKSRSVNQKGQVKNPFKCPRFGLIASDTDTLNDDKLNKQRWAMVEDNFHTAGIRLLNMEGDVGRPQ